MIDGTIRQTRLKANRIALKQGQGSFADAVIAALGTTAGCSCTLTCDQNALRLPGFEFP
jgi:predicted nucleic-acid-binding protein